MKKRASVLGRVLAAALCGLTVVSGIPSIPAQAASTQSIMTGVSGISAYDSSSGYDHIYYGTWNNSPVKWRVLDTKTNTGATGLFVLSDNAMGTGDRGGLYFNNIKTSNDWQDSQAQEWCQNFYSNNLTTSEQNAVLATTKDDAQFGKIEGGVFGESEKILNNDTVFFLSAEEASNSSYGFTDNTSRTVTYGTAGWYLRSPYKKGSNKSNVGIIYKSGSVNYGSIKSVYGMDVTRAARPAFNLDTGAVLLSSAAVGGKSSGAVGADALQEVTTYAGSDWKLTLLDSSRSFTANVGGASSASVSAGGSVDITYSGAQTGSNEYVSAVICDSNNSVLYYGNIAQSSASGTATLNIPSGLTAGSYSLKVFSEQRNDDYVTDYSSAFVNIDLTIALPKETTPTATFAATGDGTGTLSDVDTSMQYSVDGGKTWNAVTGDPMEITGITAENGVQVYKPGNGTTTSDSDVQTITVTQADQPTGVSASDCTTKEQNDGQITGVNQTMEYRLSTDSDWTAITGDTVTGLVPGTYQVRVKASGTTLASTAVTVTIHGVETFDAKVAFDFDELEEGVERPDSVTMVLYGNNQEVETVTLPQDGSWSYTFKDLLSQYKGQFRIECTFSPATYRVADIEGSIDDGNCTMIVKGGEAEKFDVDVALDFSELEEGAERPESVTLILTRGNQAVEKVTLPQDDNWSHTFKDLYKIYADDYDMEITFSPDDYSVDRIEGSIESGKYTMYVTGGKAPTPTPDPKPAKDESRQENKPCDHVYEWEVYKKATATTDGIMRYRCKYCGDVQYQVPVTAYYTFNKETQESIRKAAPGATVKVSTPIFISFHEMVKDALVARSDVSLVVDYKYNGTTYEMTIPAGSGDQLTTLFGDSQFAGFLYLGGAFPTVAQ